MKNKELKKPVLKESAPRRRTLAIMNKLLLSSAVATVGTATDIGCGSDTAIDPNKTNSDAGVCQKTDGLSNDGCIVAKLDGMPQSYDGPVVCDPLPPPLNCQSNMPLSELSNNLYVQNASWKSDSAKGFIVSVSLSKVLDYRQQLSFVSLGTVEGATTINQTQTANSLQVTFAPTQGAKLITAIINLKCDTFNQQVKLELDISGTPHDGSEVPASFK